MTDFTLSYREVIPDQTVFENWREITLTTGGTQSTLQDIKVAEKANGFCYLDSTRHHTRNRFIYWRINYDILELVEHSLDVNLTANRLRYRFDTPILDGVSIHETCEAVIVLVPTVCSIHRLLFPHPDRFHRQDDLLGVHPDLAAPSIFSKASAIDAVNPSTFYVFNNPSTATDQLPNLASSYLAPETEEAFFVLAYPSTEILLIKQNPENGQVACTELKGESLVPRFLAGIADKFRQRNSDSENIVSLLFYVVDNETYVVTLTRDAHLKFWSCSKGQCVAVLDVLNDIGNSSTERAQGAILKKAIGGTGAENTLAVYLISAGSCKFYILKPSIRGQEISMERVCTLHALENDLIDFALQSNRLWSVWRSEDGDSVVYSASLPTSTTRSATWTKVFLEALPDPNQAPTSDGDSDPRQVYLQQIFHPGRFPLHIISKALSIYKRSAVLADTQISASALKQRICLAVDNEIQNMLNGSDVDDNEYVECAEWCWQKFYSCCVQYHIASLKPLGLLLLPSVSAAVFLKKSAFSFLRPVDLLEHMTLCDDPFYSDQFINFSMISDLDSIEDLINLMKVIVYVEEQMSDTFVQAFEKELFNLESPDIVMHKLLEQIQTEMDAAFSSHIGFMVKERIGDVYLAIRKILNELRFDCSLASPDNDINPSAMYHFNSLLGHSVVAECFRQQAETRFQICRNLLLICSIVSEDKSLTLNVLSKIQQCMPDIVVLTQSNYILQWLSGLTTLVNLPFSVRESTLSRLTPLRLTPVLNLRSANTCTSLLELFISSSGSQEARKSFARVSCSDEALAHWHLSLLPYLNHLRYIISPINDGTNLVEWLLGSGQHLWLQEYVRLLSSWCQSNQCTRSFLLAAAFLTTGEFHKAEDLFEKAVEGVRNETFFTEKLLKNSSTDKTNYYLKVIHLFELHKAGDCVIRMANRALTEQVSSISTKYSKPTLFSLKFKHHLALKHYQLAFDALNANPDSERKKDNLRDLVKTLLDERKLDVLLSFTYGDMEEFFTNILLTRARAADDVNNMFYDFLYSYQIKRGPLCFRLASSAMYEQAIRLNPITSVEALEKQVKCYLIAKNVLHLCAPEHAWVVRPSDPDEEDEEVVLQPLAGSEGEMNIFKIRKQVEVVDLETMGKELAFASAQLKLARFGASSPLNISTPVELVSLLNNACLFKTSLGICKTFQLPYSSVFESLTKQCVLLSEEENPNAWNWLVENDLQDLPVKNRDSAGDIVWRYLQECLEKYEEPNMSSLHYVVTRKIINMRMYLPHWLVASYKLRNAAELLRLLHISGRLEEAVELTSAYLLSAMGYGKEFFGFSHPLAPTSPAFCLPVYAIQRLIDELKIQNIKNMDQPYLQEYNNLKSLFTKYLETATRVSNQMCQTTSTSGSLKTNFQNFPSIDVR